MEKIKVVIVNKQKTVKIPTGVRLLMRRCCHAVLELENFQGSAEVDISLVDNQQIREINKEQRNIDMVTDVLSFPLGENGQYDKNPETGASMLGDVVLSVERAIEQAEQYGHSPAAGNRLPDRAFGAASAGLRSCGRRPGGGAHAGKGRGRDGDRGASPGRELCDVRRRTVGFRA